MNKKRKNKSRKVFRSMLAILLLITVIVSSVPQSVQAVENKINKSSSKTVAESQKAANKSSVTVTNQEKLNKALQDKSIKTITIKVSSNKNFTIPDKAYKAKTLILNGPKLSVKNNGVFKKITITDAKAYTEIAKGNHITVNDKKLTFTVSKNASVKEVTFSKEGSTSNLVVDGSLANLVLSKRAKLTISGNTSDSTAILIKSSAKDSQITASRPIIVKAGSDTKFIIKKGAEKSSITLTSINANIVVENKTNKSITITTMDGKKTVAPGKTLTTGKQPEATKAPENVDNPEDTEDTQTEPTPTKKPDTGSVIPGGSGGGTGSNVAYTVTYDSVGGTVIDSVRINSGTTISNLPVPQKNNSIFLGWYTDKSFQNKFTEASPVYSNLTLYARYSEIETQQQNLNDTYSLKDQSANLAFTILSSDATMTAESVKSYLALEIADGSEAVALSVTGSNGSYTVAAQNGFTEGASYLLTLEDSRLNYKDQEAEVRKCSFTIVKAEVYNIEFKEDIIYIPSSEVSDMTQNGASTEALSVPIISMSTTESGDNTANGTFTYKGSKILKVGDVLCIYSGDKPKAPSANGDDAKYLDDSIAYIKVATVQGSMGSQVVNYTDADAEEVIFMPDVLPLFVGEGTKLVSYTTADANIIGSLQVAAADVNFAAFSELGLSAETTIDEGDFLAFYVGDFNDAKLSATAKYGEVKKIVQNNGILEVSFTATTEEGMQEVLDYYSKNDVDSKALLADVDVASLERDIEKQVQESGFAEDASSYLTALALETDGFKNVAGDDFQLESLSVQMPEGIDQDEIQIQSFASKVSIENLKVKASIGKNLQKLGGSGVRCAVTVSFDVPIEAGDESAIVISISATFVEEVKLAVDASGKAVWKKKWIFPYIADYQMNANIDIYDYTGISFKAIVSTADTGSTDISEEIQNILSYTSSEQISAGVQELFELYGEMMENETDWVDIFSQNIVTSNQHLLLGIIHIRTTIDFVVSANVNVALGCNFEYQSGTRYCFWAKIGAKDAGSNQIDLMDEKYTFQFYVMGTLGLRAGIRLEFAVGLFSVNLNSIGLTAEAGVYTRLYGYFFYQLESINKIKSSKMSGALYLDFGIYLEIAFKAQVLNGKYQYNPTLYENEWPLLSVGTRYNVFNFAYKDSPRTVKLKDSVKSYTLPDDTFHMTYLDLKEGEISTKSYKASDYNITFSNSNFSLSNNTVKVNVPTGVHKLDCNMTITWKGAPLAFSSVPMTRTYYLSWDDLNDNGYTITYNSNGGSQVSSTTKKYGEKVTAPANPVKVGYTFEGWYSDVNLTTKYTFSTMPAMNIVLYAKWIANTNTQYKVEHYQQNLVNDSYTLLESEVLTGTTESTVKAASKNYSGFTYNDSAKENIVTGTITADGSLVLKLYYNRNSYTLTFVTNNGGNNIVKTMKYGATISAPTVTKTGFTFMGWDKAVSAVMPATDLTYTAQWTPINYTIEFNANGGSAVSTITQPYGATIVAPAAPQRTGYVFGGWYRDSDLTKAYTFTTMPAENITLYAKWELNNQIAYKVEHYQQNEAGTGYTLKETENLTGTFNSKVTATAKTWVGFNNNASASETVSSGIVKADGSLVLKLYYDRNNYTIRFESNGGSNVVAITQRYGAPVSAPANPVKAGYIFEGWYSDDTMTVKYNITNMPSANITLYAKWAVGTNTQYKVEYYQQNLTDEKYTLYEAELLKGTTGSTVTATAKTLEGYTFNNSMSESTFTGTIKADESLVLKLYYDRNDYTLTFRLGNGEEDIISTVKYGAKISAPEAVRSGYSFAGWDKTISAVMPAADTTYTAQWAPMNYTIDFNTNGGSEINAIQQPYGTTLIAPTAPKKTGYIFAGWYRDSDLTKAFTFTTMLAENITLYAKWEINNQIAYKVEHYQQNIAGTGYLVKETENLTGAFETTVTATAKTWEGFTYNASAVDTVSSGAITADGGLVLKLYYDRNSYTISFISNEGTDVDTITQKYGTMVAAPASPMKTGYIFVGWYSDEDLNVKYTFTTMPAEDITLYAKWEINNQIAYKVEHYQQNVAGTGYALKETENLTGAFETIVTATAKTWVGFTYNANASEAVSSGAITVDGSLVLKLYYDRNSYTINFISNEGTDVNAITQKYGTMVAAPASPMKIGYTFVGWYSDEDLIVKYTFTTMPGQNITLYAKWVLNNISEGRLEAEDAEIYGYAMIEYSPTASNGYHVGYIDEEGSGVKFNSMQQCDRIILSYSSEMTGTISIYVNGVKRGYITLLETGSYMSMYAQVVITGLDLKEGDSLAFQYEYGKDVPVNVDYIAYTTSSTEPMTEVQLQQ